MRKLALVALLAGLMPYASAQRSPAVQHFVSSRTAAHSRPFSFPLVFFSDSFNSGYHEVPPSPAIVVQAPAANLEPQPVPPSPAESLLIELKGDRYIRVSGEEPVGSAPPAVLNQDLAPVILVFRDGHREEVAAYTIADGILYAQGNYYTDGSWNRKIDLSSLNLAETIEASRSRGVNFRLPAAPNEVVTRP